MARTSKNVALIALAGVCAVGVCKLGGACLDGASTDDIAGVENFENRVWIERIPEDERDMIAHLLFLETSDGNYGIVGRSSVWRHFIDIIMWQLNGDTLRVFVPQDRKRGKLTARTWDCEGEAPEPFELCLELSQGRHSFVMYSRHDWVVDPNGEPDAQFKRLTDGYPTLRTTFDQSLDAATTDVVVTPVDAVEDGVSELDVTALLPAT